MFFRTNIEDYPPNFLRILNFFEIFCGWGLQGCGGGVSETPCFTVSFEGHLQSYGGERSPPKFRGVGLQGISGTRSWIKILTENYFNSITRCEAKRAPTAISKTCTPLSTESQGPYEGFTFSETDSKGKISRPGGWEQKSDPHLVNHCALNTAISK